MAREASDQARREALEADPVFLRARSRGLGGVVLEEISKANDPTECAYARLMRSVGMRQVLRDRASSCDVLWVMRAEPGDIPCGSLEETVQECRRAGITWVR